MKIVRLEAENFKILKAVEITPQGDIVTIGGNNSQGKSSVLDAIWVALKGRAVAPPRPIRTGEESCTIALDMGEMKVTRKFTAKEDGKFTDSVKVEDPTGKRFPRPQEAIDEVLGELGFDPFEFVQMKPVEQAEMLLGLVPLPIDIEEMAELDESDYQTRRDHNREVERLDAQIVGIPVAAVPDQPPDRRALLEQLTRAGDTNASIASEEARRERLRADIVSDEKILNDIRGRIEELQASADSLERKMEIDRDDIANLDPLPERVSTDALREQITAAEQVESQIERQKQRATLVEQREAKKAEADRFTQQMAAREKERESALAQAKMPVEGLGFQIQNGKAIVTFGGQPFEQASRSQQIRVSAAIAMAANPHLRVLRISDGSLLDEEAIAILAEMAAAEDFQLWIEKVGTGGVGFVLENGQLKKETADG